ncbi:MAG: peptidoglycan D,D-transpeptidase FtsI family protein [Mycobacteriales bacterium]|nr:penicillin-binding protein 2 [Frankia sp.]
MTTVRSATGAGARQRATGTRVARPAPRRPRSATRPPGDPHRRLLAVLVAMLALLGVLGGRLVQLQGLDATAYAAQAERQRLRKVTLAPERGRITDRNGVPLALDVEARAVYANPKLVVEPLATARRLAPLLHRPVTELAAKLRRSAGFVYLARGLDPTVARHVVDLRLAGIGVLPETRRVYPAGKLGGAVLGFVGREGNGLAGVEYAFDGALAGRPGEMLVEEDPGGRQIPTGEHHEVAAVPGTTQVLTIDRDVQWMAEATLAQQVKATHAKGGMIIVLDPRTGEVRALASAPTFDPNRPAAAPANARGNPALSSVYEPGSVNKVITAAAAIDQGVMTPQTVVNVPSSITVADKTFTDAHPHGLERLTFTGVMAKSSNIGTITVAQQLGKYTIYDYLRRFGFGAKTGVHFPGESAGLLPPPDEWSGSQVGTVPIGQGVSVTALQAAVAYATVANGGVRINPSLLRGSVGADGRFVPAAKPYRRRAIAVSTAVQVSRMLEAVTGEGGTATAASIPGYRVAGKTGTARKVRPDGRGYSGYIASFVGYAPADDPKLLVEVVLDDPKPIFGGIVAAPVFRQVMGFALAALGIPPTGRPSPVAKLDADAAR